MSKPTLIATVIAVAMALTSVADTTRPLLTKENRFPEVTRAEIGTLLQVKEFTDENEQTKLTDANAWVVTPFARWQAARNLALRFDVPFGGLDPDTGSSETGLGDLAIGFEFRAYEDIFRFPYIIPHAQIRLDTGEEKTALGDNETSFLFGITLGSQVYDVPWYVNFDLNYEVFEDSENIFGFAGSVIWELSEQFSVLAEAFITDEDLKAQGFEEHPTGFQGGMVYHPNEDLTLGLYAGGNKNSREDVIISVRVAHDL